MAYGVNLLVWGAGACFTRPEFKVERVSYDVMTPSAARGILDAIYWQPGLRWSIDRIHVLAPIRFDCVRRNELGALIHAESASHAVPGISIDEIRQQRASVVLRDVRYGIEAHAEVCAGGDGFAHPGAKSVAVFKRRASRGQYFHAPYLGMREFPADFALCGGFPEAPAEFAGTRELGMMLLDIVYTPNPAGAVVESHSGRRLDAEAVFFEARMRDGVIDVPELPRKEHNLPKRNLPR